MAADFGIEGFWRDQFAGCSVPGPSKMLAGWQTNVSCVEGFVEPRLVARPEFDKFGSKVILIAAPGAVGKSTLARELAARLGLVLIDLGSAATVGGNYVSGGLVHTGLIGDYQAGRLGLVIDALDEARLRVVGASYDDFVQDVVRTSTLGGPPLVLLGREGVIEDTWLRLGENDVEAAILDIQRFNKDGAKDFISARLQARTKHDTDLAARLHQFGRAYAERTEELIELLASAAGEGDDHAPMNFAGYAPVLEAVTEFVAGLNNASATLNLDTVGNTIIDTILQRILERESEKITAALVLKHPGTYTGLYGPDEQRLRLISQLNGMPADLPPSTLQASIRQAYEDAVQEFLPQHPFLDGIGTAASSAVFEADLICHAMLGQRTSGMEKWARHSKPGNPFLIDMFKRRTTAEVPPEYLGALFASAQALAGPNEYAEFDFEQDGLDSDDPQDGADVSIDLMDRNEESERPIQTWTFRSSTLGEIRFLGTLGNASVVGSVNVTIGDGSGTRIDAPTSIECARLSLLGEELTVTNALVPRRATQNPDEVSVALIAEGLEAPQVSRVRLLSGASLAVEWPGSKQHPWTPYSSESPPAATREIAQARLAIRRLVIAFRSHSKGRLARFAKKIEHRRMTKGELGTVVREAMLDDGILSLEGNFYFLDADKLGSVVSATYFDLHKKQFNPQMDGWIRTKILRE
jgi:hypothetical protein